MASAASLEGKHSFEVMGTVFNVDRKYVPIKALGKGAYGVVCAAKNRETGAKVAIKRIAPMCASPVDGKHTLREVRLMRWLGKHANIISLKDLIVNAEPGGADELYVVMELFDTDLHRIIQSPQPLGDAHYKHFLFQLLRGLRFAHAFGVIHRDLKPANLLVTKSCDLCISDFGLARQVPQGAAGAAAGGGGRAAPGAAVEPDTLMTEHVVTRWYRAPELMLSADGHYTAAIDMWSVGCIFAELLGRQALFAGKDFMETLRMQIAVLGTRPADELSYIRSDQALQFLASLPPQQPVAWSRMFPDASEKALDLLDKMLQFHPRKRIAVDAALAHSYFDSVRAQYAEPDPVLPVGPGGLDFSFEGDDSLTAAHYKRLIVEETASLRSEKALARKMRAERAAAAGPGAVLGAGAGAAGGAAGGSAGFGASMEDVQDAVVGGAGGLGSDDAMGGPGARRGAAPVGVAGRR